MRQRFETEMALGQLSLPEAIAETARKRPGRVLLQDVTMRRITGRKLLVGAELLAATWRKRFGMQANRVGVLLPNVNAVPVSLLSLWEASQVPALLNYSVGPGVLLNCARLAGLKHVITSKSFLARSHLEVEPLRQAGIELIFLEDVRAGMTWLDKARALLRTIFRSPIAPLASPPESTAVILFTSGSEGEPKGVELTHQNLLSNIHQMLSVIDLMDSDRFFNALPLFHSFGLTVGLLLPLVTGSFTFLYLSPLHYRIVPAAFYNLNCTVLFATNTFLTGYVRKAHPYDFHALRYLFAGAEKLQETTSALWMRKFGVRILEGYGVTECSPCVSANTPANPRQGSAGQLLPAIQCRIEPVDGIGESEAQGASAAGRLLLHGPNVMKGYLNAEANAKFRALGGWYDTGDIARVDADGFLYILGRLKRFAKISGEMISLTAVEDILAGAFPQYGAKLAIAVISKPDESKGEKLIAITNEPRLTLQEIRDAIRARGLSNLAAPREIKVLAELPHLGTGKVDHRQLERMITAS